MTRYAGLTTDTNAEGNFTLDSDGSMFLSFTVTLVFPTVRPWIKPAILSH